MKATKQTKRAANKSAAGKQISKPGKAKAGGGGGAVAKRRRTNTDSVGEKNFAMELGETLMCLGSSIQG